MTDNRLRIVFMGTPDFALAALEALHRTRHEIAAVYTQPPRPKGRGQQVQPSPVQEYAQAHGIPVFHPASLKKEEEQAKFAALNADVAVVAAYGLLLPRAVLDAPKYGCLNIHASLLPRWRGASPIQQAILAGDERSGISIMQMDEGLDTGPVIETRALPIRPETTAGSLHDALAAMGAVMIEETIDKLAAQGGLTSAAQDENLVTYAKLLKKEDGRVDWSKSAAAIDRQIRALNPWPGVWTEFEGKKVKILACSLSPSPLIPLPSGRGKDAQRQAEGFGQILTREGDVVCGDGTVLRITRLQPESKKPMDFAAAVNGMYAKVQGKFS